MDIMKLAGGTVRLHSLQEMDQKVKDNIKITNLLASFSMVKIMPGLLTVKWATASTTQGMQDYHYCFQPPFQFELKCQFFHHPAAAKKSVVSI